MPAPSTTASRAAAARAQRRAGTARRAPFTAKDPCPHCGAELGKPHGATRRLVVFSSERGVFRWRCPDCSTAWSERASTQAGSTTRSAGPADCARA